MMVDDPRPVTVHQPSTVAHQPVAADQLERLAAEVARLGREQFRATTLLEGLGAALEELSAPASAASVDAGDADDADDLVSALESRIRVDLAKELLPVVDAVDHSIGTARTLLSELRVEPGAPPGLIERGALLEAWIEGLRLIERRLLALLDREGVRPIAALDQPFDPHRHIALAVAPSAGVTAGTVIAEELRGFTVGDRVLRHAEVVVAGRADG